MQRMLKRVALSMAAAAVMTLGLPASNASAMNETACTTTDLLWVSWGDVANNCFANAGTTEVDYWNLTKVSTGNNAVHLKLRIRGVGLPSEADLPKWSVMRYPSNTQLLSLQIY